MSKRSQEKLFAWLTNSESKSMLSRVTPKARGVRHTLKCGAGKKEVQTQDVVLFSMPRETESMEQKILEVFQKRKPRETESTCEKSFKT